MTVIEVAERGHNADGSFQVRVSFSERGEYEVTVTNPLDRVQEDRLAWYFEEHLRYPFLDQEVARRAVADLRALGTDLFEQLFAGPASHDYRTLAGQAFDGCRLQVQGSAAFHRLHWEALVDPASGSPLAVRMPVTRRIDGLGSRFDVANTGDTLNILVVTARPDGSRDVGYRTISRPLLDGLAQADRPVRIELVRPGTWAALRARLREATREHGSGLFHVVHFDVHGSVATHEDMARGRASQRYLFGDNTDEPAGAASGEEFDGERGFLFFETATIGKAQPVSAGQVAQLLSEHRVPVAVLNACQSAKESASEASLAQRLVEAGVPVAVGMAYSVTVSAAERAMPALYAGLSRGLTPVAASFEARQALFDQKARQAYFDQQLELEDWVLPVVFAQRPLQIELQEMIPERQTAFFTRQAEFAREPRPEYGFVGRDLDIHALERALLLDPQRNMVLVQGMAGAGKSTLLEHLRWWWHRTGLVEDTFAFSYEQRAWNAGQVLREIATRLLDPVGMAKHELMPPAAQVEQIAGLLRARRYLVVLDNIESITAGPAAIPHSLTPGARIELADFLARLRGGRTLVMFGSREAESWLAPDAFEQNVYRLPGLDEQAASVLTHRILTRHGGARHETDTAQREALRELTRLLGGYPLPLTVVLPMLASRTPAQVLEDLRQGAPDADPVGLIARAIEYSHGKLDPTTQHSLLLLAPFTATIPAPNLLQPYLEALAEHSAVAALGDTDLGAAVSEAVRVGLAGSHPQLDGFVQVLPVLPYFLRTRLAQVPGLAEALAQAHYRLYAALGPDIQQLLTSNQPQERVLGHAVAAAEYANLTTAIQHALSTAQPVMPVLGAVEELLDQTRQQPTRRQLLDQARTVDRPADREDLRREQAQLHNLAGVVAQEQGRFADAEQAYRQVLELWLEFDDRHGAASTYHQLGVVAQEQGRFADAVTYLARAAANWYASTGQWPPETIVVIKQAGDHLDIDHYQRLLVENVPADLLSDLQPKPDSKP